jgi:FAD/FMN-containing dehydrogenase/Fe-S oxidoreductase
VDDSVRRRAEYSSDASNYRVVPDVVVFPRDPDEVLAAVAVCRAEGIPLTCRGAGTSIAGNAIGPGVVLDFSRHLNRVLSVDPDAATAVVQPGAVLDDVSAAGAPYGLRFGPDPSTHSRATVAGALGNNACGARALRYGRSVDNVVSLDVVTAAGARFTAGDLASAPMAEPLTELVAANLAPIRQHFGRFARQGSGYLLDQLLPEKQPSLARFLCGSEGTLAVTLAATVRLVDRPPATALAVLGYPDLPAAAAAVPAVLAEARPVALEGMDSRLVDVLRRRRGQPLPGLPDGSGWLFAELAGPTQAEAVAEAERLARKAGCLDSVVLTGAAAAQMWLAREDGAGLGGRTPADRPAWPGWEDAAVPPERLAEYLGDFTALLRRYDLDGLLYGHFGDGCVHTRIDFPLRDRPRRFRDFVTEAAELVGGYGGSMSGEHGDGRARGALLPAMYPPPILALFGEVKRLFDPDRLLNPGIVVDPPPVDADLRLPLVSRTPTALALRHDDGDLATAVHRCVGIGRCRATNSSATVMCPSYLATRDEKDSTRGRARVLQEAVNGRLVGGLAAPEVAESLDLCLSCKGCSSDCPAGIDVATYKAEALYRRYRRKPRPIAHYSLGWLPAWSRLAALAPRLVNVLLNLPVLAGLMKRAAGVDPRRGLPSFARPGFRRRFRRRFRGSPAASGAPVLLWVDTFTERFSPSVGQAAVRVLEAAGYAVTLPGPGLCCGLTWVSTGQLDTARRRLRASLRALAPALSAGLPIVVLEPSCAAVFRSDARELLPDEPLAAAAATAVRTLAELLDGTDGWAPPDLTGVTAVAQPHCHHHAVLGWGTDARLLAAAGATVERLPGCCGLAGNWGVETGHYETSVAVAETALLPALRRAEPGTAILADGFSCRTQIGELSDRRPVHLAELLASRLPPPG